MILGFLSTASAADVYPIPELSFRYEGTEVIMDIRFYYSFSFESGATDRGPTARGDIVEIEIDGIPQMLRICHFECDELTASSNCTVANPYMRTTSINLGEITGTPPKIRARSRRVQCMPNEMSVSWGYWSGLKEAVVPEPLLAS
jgi:hypothetical protein